MNCSGFESVVVGIVRDEMAEAGLRDSALAHAGMCARCSRRLMDEQMLSEAFLAAASEHAAREAPPVVEKMLLAAFREQQATSQHRQRAWVTRAVVGAAAAIIVVAGLWALRRPEPPGAPLAVSNPSVSESEPASRETVEPLAKNLQALAETLDETPGNDAEEMSSFIPVVYDATPVELWRVVRVQVPREALIAFGLPFHEPDQGDELIGADVLLGDDGLARAVRFVR